MEGEFFRPESVISFINEEILKDSGDISLADIRQKNVQAIVKVYHAFLLSLGYSRDMFLNQFSALFENHEPETDELLKDEEFKLKLCSLLSWLLSQIDLEEKQFSYEDVSNPDQERAIYFMGILQNFYLVIKERKGKDSEIEENAMMLKARQEQLVNGLQNCGNIEKDKKSYIEKYENGLTALKQLMAAEEELSEHVVANEEEVAKAEAIYNQELENKTQAEKVIKTVETISYLRTTASQLDAETNALDEDCLVLKKVCDDQYEPLLEANKRLAPEEEKLYLKSIIEEHRVEERSMAREEKHLDKESSEAEMDLENVKTNIKNSMSKFNARREMIQKDLESLAKDISKVSGNEQTSEVQELLVMRNKLTDQNDGIEHEIMDLERKNEEFSQRIRASLDRFGRNTKSDLLRKKEAALAPPRA